MKSLAQRTIASVATVAALSVAAPALAMAASPTTTTTTTVAVKTQVITTLKQYRAAERAYETRLNAINLTFLAAANAAKTNLVTSLSLATNSGQRISARATYRYALTEATIARSDALNLLGNPPVKPSH